ncbi:hypothetical protein B9Z55_015258 [Caenorhabditis nigoni]|uniref:F-box domain-containing protein n=1 Tax=Caenorhabditis nigoni TaxID=1611254 RepID=A0A2G5U9N2_9PELO|nr:hypothetical protein B9Z55_015258 [Caenorhabditis nigoni]
MPFPILQIPFDVRSEIISLLRPNEIVTASFSSKNFKRLIKKQYQRPSKLKFDVHIGYKGLIGNCQGIVLSAEHISELSEKAHEIICTNGYKRGFSSKFPVLYFENRVMGTKMIIDYVTDLFGTCIDELYVDRNGIWAIDWINSRQSKPLACLFLVKADNGDPIADEEAEYVLRYSKIGELLDIRVKVSENFRLTGKLGPFHHLSISEGQWINCDNLMNVDATVFAVHNSRLTDSELNAFLRHWRSGGSPRLEVLDMNFEREVLVPAWFDPELEIVETDEVRRYRYRDGSEMEIQGGFSIQRMDGVNATIVCDLGQFCMVVWHSDGH